MKTHKIRKYFNEEQQLKVVHKCQKEINKVLHKYEKIEKKQDIPLLKGFLIEVIINVEDWNKAPIED